MCEYLQLNKNSVCLLRINDKNESMKQTTWTQEQKTHWVNKAKRHQELDQFKQGLWWNEKTEKGCEFGCLLEQDENVLRDAPELMNIPAWVVHIFEKIFEGLSVEDSKTWVVDSLDAIPVDADLTEKWRQWNIWLLTDQR